MEEGEEVRRGKREGERREGKKRDEKEKERRRVGGESGRERREKMRRSN